jgi:hypothetical protein
VKKIPIVHDELGESEVVPSALPVWLDRGWRVREDSASSKAASASPDSNAPQAQSDVTASPNSKKNITHAKSRS